MDPFLELLQGNQSIDTSIDSNLTSSIDHQGFGQPPTFTRHSLLKMLVLSVIAALSLMGNLAMLLNLTCYGTRRKSTLYRLLLQLAIADLLVTLWCICGEAAWTFTVQWIAGNEFCKIFKYFQVFSLYLSTFVMVVIALDRLRAIRSPVKRISSSRSFCTKYILAAWFLSGILASPQLAVFRVVRGPFQEDFFQCVTYGSYTEPWQEQLYSIFSICTMFLAPLVAFFVIYIIIFITISRNERLFKTHPESSSNRSTLLRRAKLRTLRISLAIVACFLICWTPYYVMMIVFVFTEPSSEVSEHFMSGIFFFGMSNSLVNPVIYGAFHLWRPARYLPGYTNTSKESSRRGSQRPASAAAAAADPAEVKENHCFL